MEHWAPAPRVHFRGEMQICRPEFISGIGYLDCVVFSQGRLELQVEIIGNAQIAFLERRIKHSPLKPELLNGELLCPLRDDEFSRRRQMAILLLINKIPLFNARRVWLFGRDQRQFKNSWRKDV